MPKNFRLLAFLVLCTLPFTASVAQEILPRDRQGAPPLAVELSREQARILAGIRADDSRAIVDAGHSRDRTFLEALRGALRRNPPDYQSGNFSQVNEALAQLGDTEQLQRVWCLSIDERSGNVDGYFIAARLARIGGWFSLQVFDYLLTANGRAHWERAMRRGSRAADLIYAPPDSDIPELLSRVVRNPPAVSEKDPRSALRAWMAEHRPELSLLQPTGEGVDLSPAACKDGQPRDRRQRR
jgi:hypothetical protein